MKYLYIRVSISETRQSTLRQGKFGRENNIPVSNWFRESASGARDDRVELNRLLSIVKEGDQIYCVDPSRLTRSLKYLLSLIDFAKQKKIKLVLGDFILDCSGELSVYTQGQLMMLGLINEMQRLMIVESVKEGLAAAKEKNGGISPGGRPKTTVDTIPEVFYKYYPMYKNSQITKVEFSRISGLSRSSIYKYISIVERK